jgi:hypothetical protein
VIEFPVLCPAHLGLVLVNVEPPLCVSASYSCGCSIEVVAIYRGPWMSYGSQRLHDGFVSPI